jgi:FtsZ-binding cell division protein ZapB
MSETVKRYTPVCLGASAPNEWALGSDIDGSLVLHDDYLALERERDELRKERNAAVKLNGQYGRDHEEILSVNHGVLLENDKLRAELSTLKAENIDLAEGQCKLAEMYEAVKAENERLRREVHDLQDELKDARDGGMPTLDSDGVQQTL